MPKNSYIEVIDVTVAGIPCKAGVIDFNHQRGSYSYHAASDWDYYGHTDMDWDLLDRKGHVAGKWLTDKMTDDDIAAIEEAIFEAMMQPQDDF